MTPEARLQAAIEILSDALQTNQPVDRFLKYWFSGRRFAGSKDRAAISERVYVALRRRAEFAWRMKSESPRSVLIASLLDEGLTGDEIKAFFDRGNYGPAPLSVEELAALSAPSTDDMPDHVRGGYPKWLEPELKRAFGERIVPEMQAMLARAPVDLRVNALRAERGDMLTGLRSLDFEWLTSLDIFGIHNPCPRQPSGWTKP